MKSNVAAAAALVLLLSAFPSLAARAREAYATRWLREHPAAEVDELAELKSQNPGAYAIVKALLTKRSLGLLNPKHPSASFQTPAQSEGVDAASGPAAFQALASPGPGASAVDTEAQGTSKLRARALMAPAAPAHRDWLHWKPTESAADDEAMVNSVLGAVAQMKGGRSHQQGEEDDSKEGTQDSAPDQATPADTQPAAKSSAVRAPALASSASDSSSTKQMSAEVDASAGKKSLDSAAPENPYLRGLDLGASTPAAPARPANRENSYLKSVDLGVSTAKPHVQDDSTDYLASFSWDDKPQQKAAPSRPKREVTSTHSAEKPQAQQHSNALLAWLGGGSGQDDAHEQGKASQLQQPAAPAEHQNAYLDYLK